MFSSGLLKTVYVMIFGIGICLPTHSTESDDDKKNDMLTFSILHIS